MVSRLGLISSFTSLMLLFGCVSDSGDQNSETITEDSVANSDAEDVASDALESDAVPTPDMPAQTTQAADADAEVEAVEAAEIEAAEPTAEAIAKPSDVDSGVVSGDIMPTEEPATAAPVLTDAESNEVESEPAAAAPAPALVEKTEPEEKQAPAEETAIETAEETSSVDVADAPTMVEKDIPSAKGSSADLAGYGEYVVRPGDTLSKIAKRIYGSAGSVSKLVNENSLENPNLIFPGDVIRFDRAGSQLADAMTNPKSETIVVRRGDTLSKIAQKIFGSADSWKYLWRLNQASLADPNRLSEGATLTLVYPADFAGRSESH